MALEVKIEPKLAGLLPCTMEETTFTFSAEGDAEPAWGPGHMAPSFARDYGNILEAELLTCRHVDRESLHGRFAEAAP